MTRVSAGVPAGEGTNQLLVDVVGAIANLARDPLLVQGARAGDFAAGGGVQTVEIGEVVRWSLGLGRRLRDRDWVRDHVEYREGPIKGAIQAIRVVRPIAVDKTLIESWTFRLKGAPPELLDTAQLRQHITDCANGDKPAHFPVSWPGQGAFELVEFAVGGA